MEIIDKALSQGRSKLLENEAYDLLAKYSIPVPEHCLARNMEGLQACSSKVTFPHALKIVSPDIVHKSDVGGVIIGLRNINEDINAYRKIVENISRKAPGTRIEGVLVQQMVPEGLEVIVGGIRDRFFDIVVMFGLGGIFVEVLHDVSFRVSPLTYRDALEMLDDIKANKVLYGFRGMPPRDREALAKIIYGIYQLMEKHRNIKEIDLNPVMSYEHGAYIADARVIVGQ